MSDRPLCFFVMPFSKTENFDRWEYVYNSFFCKTFEKLGYDCERFELSTGSLREKLMKKLICAALVVVDVSYAIPNVLFELGVRYALDTERIILVKSNSKESNKIKVPSDLNDIQYHTYSLNNQPKFQSKMEEVVNNIQVAKECDGPVYKAICDLLKLHQGPQQALKILEDEKSFPLNAKSLKGILDFYIKEYEEMEKKYIELSEQQENLSSALTEEQIRTQTKEIKNFSKTARHQSYLSGAKVVSFINLKGGVGKTALSCHVAAGINKYDRSQKVLIIDLDPQASLSALLMGQDVWQKQTGQGAVTIFDLFNDFIKGRRGKKNFDFEKSKVTVHGIDLIPADMRLASIETDLAEDRDRIAARQVLLKFVNSVRNHYDYIIFDCAPNSGLINQNALIASSKYIIPVNPNYLSIRGAELLWTELAKKQEALDKICQDDGDGEDLTFGELAGLLVTRFANIKVQNTLLAEIERKNYPIFDKKIPESNATWGEIMRHQKLVFDLSRGGKIKETQQAFCELIKEFVNKI